MPKLRDLRWRGDELFYSWRRVARIVRDQVYPEMWRVERPDGTLSGMLSRVWAKEAAMLMVGARHKVGVEPAKAPPVR